MAFNFLSRNEEQAGGGGRVPRFRTTLFEGAAEDPLYLKGGAFGNLDTTTGLEFIITF